jgi:hypothetical protein
VVLTADNPEQRAVLQVVGRRSEVTFLDEWGDRKPKTQIVAIGSRGNINADELNALFEACTVENVTRSF